MIINDRILSTSYGQSAAALTTRMGTVQGGGNIGIPKCCGGHTSEGCGSGRPDAFEWRKNAIMAKDAQYGRYASGIFRIGGNRANLQVLATSPRGILPGDEPRAQVAREAQESSLEGDFIASTAYNLAMQLASSILVGLGLAMFQGRRVRGGGVCV